MEASQQPVHVGYPVGSLFTCVAALSASPLRPSPSDVLRLPGRVGVGAEVSRSMHGRAWHGMEWHRVAWL